jgi:hypothetical protein
MRADEVYLHGFNLRLIEADICQQAYAGVEGIHRACSCEGFFNLATGAVHAFPG